MTNLLVPIGVETITLEPNAPVAETGRTERVDAQANRARILAAAKRLFAEKGVEQVNMVEIGRAALSPACSQARNGTARLQRRWIYPILSMHYWR